MDKWREDPYIYYDVDDTSDYLENIPHNERYLARRVIDEIMIEGRINSKYERLSEESKIQVLYYVIKVGDIYNTKALIKGFKLPLQGALTIACKEDDIKISQYLIYLGADPNESLYRGPLYYAVDNRNLELIELSIENGARVDFVHFALAIKDDRPELFDLLLAYGGDISYEDAEEIATLYESYDILKYLKKLREASRKRAANVIHKNLLHAYYRPEGVGYFKAMDDFKTRMSKLP